MNIKAIFWLWLQKFIVVATIYLTHHVVAATVLCYCCFPVNEDTLLLLPKKSSFIDYGRSRRSRGPKA